MLTREDPTLRMNGQSEQGAEAPPALQVRILCRLIGGIEHGIRPANVAPPLAPSASRHAHRMFELAGDRPAQLVTVPESVAVVVSADPHRGSKIGGPPPRQYLSQIRNAGQH